MSFSGLASLTRAPSSSVSSIGGHGRFKRLQRIGEGSFGDVFKALDTETNEVVAVKVINLEVAEEEIEEIREEITMLSECHSSYVTRYITSYTSGPELCIVMEFLGGGSVHDLLDNGPLDESYVAIIMRELLKAIDYLHSNAKIHRDIKAANILLSSKGEVKISDFGVTAKLTHTIQKRNTLVGTPYWMAPEVIQQSDYNEKADIWSIGITALEIFLGQPPLHDLHPMKALFQITSAPAPNLESHPTASKPFKEFITLCCQKEYEKRPSTKTLLSSKFIRGAKKNALLQDLLMDRQMKQEASKLMSTRRTGGGTYSQNGGGDGINEDLGEEMMAVEEEDNGGEDENWSFTVKNPSVTAAATAAAANAAAKAVAPAAAQPPPVASVPRMPSPAINSASRPASVPVSTPSSEMQGTVKAFNPSVKARLAELGQGDGGVGTVRQPNNSNARHPSPNASLHALSYLNTPASNAASNNALTNTLPSRYASNTMRGPNGEYQDDVSSGSSSDEDDDADGGTVRMASVARDYEPPPTIHDMFQRPSVVAAQKAHEAAEAVAAVNAAQQRVPPPVVAKPSVLLKPSPRVSPVSSTTSSPASSAPATPVLGARTVVPGVAPPSITPSPFAAGVSRAFTQFGSEHATVASLESGTGLILVRLRAELEALELAAGPALATELVRIVAQHVGDVGTPAGSPNTATPNANAPPVPPYNPVRRNSKPPIAAFAQQQQQQTHSYPPPAASPPAPTASPSRIFPSVGVKTPAPPSPIGAGHLRPVPVSSSLPVASPVVSTPPVAAGFSTVKNLWQQKDSEAAKHHHVPKPGTLTAAPHLRQASK